MWKYSVILEHHGGIPLIGRYFIYEFPINVDIALILLVETGNGPQKRRLATARRAKQRKKLAFFNL
ncbi:MAG: hypothetical protein BWX44_01738 [Spirochaetes bacterium ADurb.Bin001]|nr:MAG: hypothetical protein BWX44_01738 [Spirochaetes bacterium ADurb.Bin001]